MALVQWSCSLHASTDFREKLYKVFVNVAKLAAAQRTCGPHAAQIASTLSQSRGIFKLFKWVTCIQSYRDAIGDEDPLVRRLKKVEAWLNGVVSGMQDCISLDKLCSAHVVGANFVWWMNFLDLLLSLLLASLAANAIRLLQVSGSHTPKAQLLLLRLELGVRVFDAIALLEVTCTSPGKRRLWRAPSPYNALLANVLSAACSTSAVGIKKWAVLPAPSADTHSHGHAQQNGGLQTAVADDCKRR